MPNAIKFVERAFDGNDWFILAAFVLSFGAVILSPRKLPRSTTCLSLIYGITIASLFDNSIAFSAFDYYDIMDGPAYTVMDLFVYLLYAPFGYFFIYFYERLRVGGVGTVFYILVFAALSFGFEWLCHKVGVFHYRNGYLIFYSFVIYLFVQSFTVMFYRWIRADDQAKARSS